MGLPVKKYLQLLIVSCLLGLSFPMPASAEPITIDKIVAFGDSLSDNGNIYSLTSAAHKITSAIPIIPMLPPYYQGRFTNGPVWIELLADALHVPLLDYAYGGAWVEPVNDSKQLVPLDLNMQINYFLVTHAADFHKDQHLFTIWIGANDYVQGREDVEYATTNAVAYIQQQIERLIYHGAKRFLLLNVPDLSQIPEVIDRGQAAIDNVRELATSHNAKFGVMVENLRAAYPDVHFVLIDVTNYFDDIINNPHKFTLNNVRDACYRGGYYLNMTLAGNPELRAAKEKLDLDIAHNAVLRQAYIAGKAAALGTLSCSDPDDFLFWDHIHPTRIIHAAMSVMALNELHLQGVEGPAQPEPEPQPEPAN